MPQGASRAFRATALPAGALALALTVWACGSHAADLTPAWIDLALAAVFAILSYSLSFSPSLPGRVSLVLAYWIAAALALPFPAAVLVGVISALGGTAVRIEIRRLGPQFAAVAGANVAIAAMMTASAAAIRSLLGGPAPSSNAPLGSGAALALAALMFAAMSVVNFAAMTAWVALRGERPAAWAKTFATRILPGETVTIPFGSLLGLALASRTARLEFALLATVGLFASYLLKILSDSRERLRNANHDLEDRVAELATLNAIGREVSSSLDPTRVFKIVRRECRKVLAPDFFWIARVDNDSHEVEVEYSMAGDVPSRTTRFPLGQGLTSFIVRSEKPLLVLDASKDPRLRGMHPIVIEPKIRSILAVPLLVENRVVGVISVQCFREKAYEERHISLLSTIGQQAAVALENARHYQLATIDHLTGLFQRDHFFQRVADEHRRASRYGTTFSLLMLDLDGFKRINDRFGHFAGDRFLKAVGASIRSMLRAADAPCRYGGEEFCILLPETDLAGARVMAERIRTEIGAMTLQDGPHIIRTTVSIGISSFPVHFEGNLMGLLQKADQALYQAKKQGRDRVISAAA